MRSLRRLAPLAFLLALLAPPPVMASPPLTLQQVFASAAREFGVPPSILLSVSYNLTLWDEHGGAPSISGGYGLMHLTHARGYLETNARGDGMVRLAPRDPALQTLDFAARLLHESPARLRTDPVQNVRGGAALLAREEHLLTGTLPTDPGRWYAAVAAYSHDRDASAATLFASDVFGTIRQGAVRRTDLGQIVRLHPLSVTPSGPALSSLHLRTHQPAPRAQCPVKLHCLFTPAAYAVNSADPTDYGNYDVAHRPRALAIRYIVIHDTEGPYSSAIATFQTSTTYASANYVIRSSDGQITQMVPDSDIAWHAANYWFNMHAIGIEHEGVAIDGATWYDEPLYRSSARLVKYLAHLYNIPLDRQHIIGHDEVPGFNPAGQSAQHWDPGPYWDWAHYMALLGAPEPQAMGTAPTVGSIITINPDFLQNQPPVTSCSTCAPELPQGTNFVYLRTAPDPSAPLLADPALHPSGAGTQVAADWGDKAVTGQEYVVAGLQNDWIGINYGGQVGWFQDPNGTIAVPVSGTTITPAPGLSSVQVYGIAYPDASAYPKHIKPQPIAPLQYTIPAGQQYVATDLNVPSDYYDSPTQHGKHTVITGETQYDVIVFNHRLALVRARDVSVVAPSTARYLLSASSKTRRPVAW